VFRFALPLFPARLSDGVGTVRAGPIASGPNFPFPFTPSINPIDELSITVTATNKGSEDANILKYGLTLHDGATKPFTIFES
jgi:hypothetical protein